MLTCINKIKSSIIVLFFVVMSFLGESNAAILVGLFENSSHNTNTAVMDATLGISGLNIEDFEDATLVGGLSYTLSNVNGGTFTSLPNLFDITSDPAWLNGSWDGTRVLSNAPNNSFAGGPAASNTLTFNVQGGATVFGVGLANFQSLSSAADQFPIGQHELFINGNSFNLLEALAGWSAGRTVRNGYLMIQATGGDIINSVGFSNVNNHGDILLFDRVAFNSQAVPEPATMAILGLGLVGAAMRRKKDNSL